MAEILTELQILESTIQYGSDNLLSAKDSHGYYKNLLGKYGYTYEQFDTIRKWYASNPELFQKVYDQVVVNLSKRETELGLLLDKEKKEEELLKKDNLQSVFEKDLSELWQEPDSIVINPRDTIDKRVPFYIETDTLELTGMLRLSASYKFLNNDESKNPQMMLSAFYNDNTADTLFKEIPHSFQKTSAYLNLYLNQNKETTKINGYLLWQDSLLNASVEITSISLSVFKDSVKIYSVKKDSVKIQAVKKEKIRKKPVDRDLKEKVRQIEIEKIE